MRTRDPAHPRAKKVQSIELEITQFHHTAAATTTLEHVLNPYYWGNNLGILRVGSRIEVLAADGSWWAMLLVTGIAPELNIQIIQHVDLEPVTLEIKDYPDYEILKQGAGYIVRYTPDDMALRGALPSASAAHEWFARRVEAAKAKGVQPYEHVVG